MAELADAPALGAGVFDVGVQIPLSAPKEESPFGAFFFWCHVKLKRDLNGQVAATEKLMGTEKLRLNGGHPPFTAPA